MEENKNTNVSEEIAETTETAKTYSEEEVMKLIQREADRRVNQALEKQKKHYEKQLSLSSLDDEAREKAEKDMRIGEDMEDAQKKIESFDKLYKASVQEEVKKRLSSTVPVVGADSSGTINKDIFNKMSLAQRTELYKSDPDLYKQLSKN